MTMTAPRPERRVEALRLREQGATFGAIGLALGGVSRQRAEQLVRAAQRDRAAEAADQRELVRRREIAYNELRRLLGDRDRLAKRIRDVRTEIVVLGEELEAREIDRLLGLTG